MIQYADHLFFPSLFPGRFSSLNISRTPIIINPAIPISPEGFGPNRASYPAAQISSGASLTALTAPWAIQAGHMLPSAV